MNENKSTVKPVTIPKPLTLVKEDFTDSLVDLCNNSGLPFFIIESILKDFVQEIHVASQKQLEADKIQYKKALQDTKS
jgi:hypothetical protein